MRFSLCQPVLAAAVALPMLLSAGAASAATASAVNLTAQRTSTTLPDANTVPMWGYCYTPVTAATTTTPAVAATNATLLGGAACSGTATPAGWQPGPTIVIPYDPSGNSLTISLTNTLPTPTSIVILGQLLGGGLGTPVKVSSPAHAPQTSTTWVANGAGSFKPPAQPSRVQSFATEVGAGSPASGTTVSLTWANLKPGTYLYETGTHPSVQGPMGLYGVLVVTQAAIPAVPATTTTPATAVVAGVAYPAAAPAVSAGTYDADAVLLFSEIDAVQNAAMDAVACPPTGTAAPCAQVALIDPLKYPPAVNFAPTYFLINGRAYDPTNPAASNLPIPPAAASGNVLLRFLNAGSRTHIPTVIGLPMGLLAEDGNVAPGKLKVQNEVLLTAGKTYDVLVNPPTAAAPAAAGTYAAASYSIFDRELGTSTGNQRNGGMQAYLQVNGGPATAPGSCTAPNPSLTIPANSTSYSGNVLTNFIGIASVTPGSITTAHSNTVSMNANGTFVFTVAAPGFTAGSADSFTYTAMCSNGTVAPVTGTVSLAAAGIGAAPVVAAQSFTSPLAKSLLVSRPGVLKGAMNVSGYALTATLDAAQPNSCGAALTLNADGSFLVDATKNVAVAAVAAGSATPSCTFNYIATNSQGTVSNSATAAVFLTAGSGLNLIVQDAQTPAIQVTDYRWIIEEDTTFHSPTGVTPPGVGTNPAQTLGTSFHKSYMPVVATGCTGPKSCGESGAYQNVVNNGGTSVPVAPRPRALVQDVALDPNKYYFVSIMSGDASDPFAGAYAAMPDCTAWNESTPNPSCGHTMTGAAIGPKISGGNGWSPTTPLKAMIEPNPLQPAQISILAYEDNSPTNGSLDGTEETQGLGGFEVIVFDTGGKNGDPIGQVTYDVYNMPLTNALYDTYGYPINPQGDVTDVDTPPEKVNLCPSPKGNSPIGVVFTCPEGSQLAGQALIKGLEPSRYDVIVHPGAAREGNGEVWIQTETLEGTPANDAFAKVNEPVYFQEFGPPGPHTVVGFVNPAHVKQTNAALTGKKYNVTGRITNLHMARPSDVTLWDSHSHATMKASTCYVALNDQNGIGVDVGMATCDGDGNFTISGIPAGSYQLAIWDQWLDQIFAFKAVVVNDTTGSSGTVALGDYPVFSWFTRIESSTFLDMDGSHMPAKNPGVSGVPTTVRYRDGSYSNALLTDSNGKATFNELFPLFNWYVMESDYTRFKSTGVHVVVDAGGKVDTSGPYAGILNSHFLNGTSSERVDPPSVRSEGVQSFVSQTLMLDFGKVPYATGENGGITGLVVYASTRPFDDPNFGSQNFWEPLVPRVTINLYQESTAPDGTTALTLIDTTQTSSWDDAVNDPAHPMSCPGMNPNDPFVSYTVGAANVTRCFDGFRAFNQVQPAPYDGRYQFPSAAYAALHPLTAAQKAAGQTMVSLPPGKYITEVVLPTGYEIVKEEDKNILIGDQWVAPASQQFAGLGNIFILPDQATLRNANTNAPLNGDGIANNATTDLGSNHGKNSTPLCAGNKHRVPNYLALFPNAAQVAPFAGADRALCDRREVNLEDQMQATANFLVFTPVQIAAHYTGMILDDSASEFNPASPSFGEKFAVPFTPVSIRDWNGVEVSRTYSDQWGMYNGLTPSSWEVNVPNPAGFSPNMMITCMNDPGPVPGPNGTLVNDPQYNRMYSNFCYTKPFMPGLTDYLDTPVVPTAAFASGYDPVDCEYPATGVYGANTTPAIRRVDGNAGPITTTSTAGSYSYPGNIGPFLDSSKAMILTIQALGDVPVLNPAYVGPSASTAPYNQRMINRHYGFGPTAGTVTIGGRPVTVTAWSDTAITLAVPKGTKTGELILTAANGKSTIDTVTVTIEDSTQTGYRGPHYVKPGISIQSVVDGAYTNPADFTSAATDHGLTQPGDLVIVDAGSYPELVILWYPLRLQGVGAASVTINAAKYPTEKLANWQKRVNQLFLNSTEPQIGTDTPNNPQVNPLPGQEIADTIVANEAVVLSDAEGAGITVLGQPDCRQFDGAPLDQAGGEGGCPMDQKHFGNYAVDADGNPISPASFLGNFSFRDPKHPSRIDGLTVTGGDTGGGIFVDAWAHNLELANLRVYGNAGVFAGGIRIGQPFLEDAVGGPLNYNMNVRIHNNYIATNGALESNNGNGGAGGGLSISSGTDNYRVESNWVCGNYSQDDGGGMGHVGVSTNGVIYRNWFLFNQSFNQSTTTSGGGLTVMGEAVTGNGGQSTATTFGTGNVLIDSNLFLGNHAQGGHGGGLRLQDVNGDDVAQHANDPSRWYRATVTNNIIVDNVAAWSGGGISIENTVNALIVNNTIARNDSTATAGPLFVANAPGTLPMSTAQPAGVSAERHSPDLVAVLNNVPPAMRSTYSDPVMENNIIWGNRSFYFQTNGPQTNGQAVPTQLVPNLVGANGSCPSGEVDWDLGVVGESQSTPTVRLHPNRSVLTSTTGYPGATGQANIAVSISAASSLAFNRFYCNGSRVPTGVPNENAQIPPFAFLPASAEDEGGNFIDVRYGPLSLNDLVTGVTPYGDYRIGATSAAKDVGLSEAARSAAINAVFGRPALSFDFFATDRPRGPAYDIGAHEFVEASLPIESFDRLQLDFGTITVNTRSQPQTVTLTNTGSAPLTGIVVSLTGANPANYRIETVQNACAGTLNAGSSCAITVTFRPLTVGSKPASVTIASAQLPAATITLTGTGAVPAGSLLIAPTAVSFGTWPVNSTSNPPSTITLRAVGGPVVLSAAQIVTGNAGDFVLNTSTCGTLVNNTLQQNQNCNYTLTFKPSAAGSRQSTLTVNPVNLPQQTVTLTGSGAGQAGSLLIAPTAVSFGTWPVNSTSNPPRTVTLRAVGGPVVLSAAQTATGNAGDFVLNTSTCGTLVNNTLQQNQNCNYTLTFKPSAPGGRQSTLNVNPVNLPRQTVTLIGYSTPLAAAVRGVGLLRKGH